jgi:hypothetical protein
MFDAEEILLVGWGSSEDVSKNMFDTEEILLVSWDS